MASSSCLSAVSLQENERPAEGIVPGPSKVETVGLCKQAFFRQSTFSVSEGNVFEPAASRGVPSRSEQTLFQRKRRAEWVFTDDEFRDGGVPDMTRLRSDDMPSRDQENLPPLGSGDAGSGQSAGRTGSLADRALGELPVDLPEDFEEHSYSEVESDDDDEAEELGCLALRLEERIRLNEGGRYVFQIYEDP